VLRAGRRELVPEGTFVDGRTLRHRHYLPNDWEFHGGNRIPQRSQFSRTVFANRMGQRRPTGPAVFRSQIRGLRNLLQMRISTSKINDFFQENRASALAQSLRTRWVDVGDRLTWSNCTSGRAITTQPARRNRIIRAVAAVTGDVAGEFAPRGNRRAKPSTRSPPPIQAGAVKHRPVRNR